MPKIKHEEKEINQQDLEPFIQNVFSVKLDDGTKAISEKARWYVDNESIFMGTHAGDILHFSQTGKLIKRGSIHPEIKIKSFTFSHDFSILATAARDGCKVVNPETL